MPDSLLASRIVDEDMYRNFGTQRMLLEVEEESRKALNAEPLQMVELVALNKTGLTVEHILPQKPNFHLVAYGFVDAAEYLQHKHKLGNLMLLEGPLNSACNNRTVEDKMSSDRLYGDSRMSSVKTLVARHAGQAGFNKTSIEDRGKAIALLVTRRWPHRASRSGRRRRRRAATRRARAARAPASTRC